jgi:type II secretion system protein C
MIRIADIAGRLVHDQTLQNRILGLVELCLVLLIAVTLARLVLDLIPPTSEPGIESAVVSAPQSQDGLSSRVGMDEAMSVSPALIRIFGTADTTAVTEVPEQALQQTPLNLVLKGILADQGTQNRYALIAAGGQKERVYRTGEQVEGAEIVRIESRRVVIRRNGITEALNLVARKLSGNTDKTTGTARFNLPAGIVRISDTERMIPRSTLEQHMKNLPALLLQATALPQIDNGQQTGFRIVNLKQGSVFEQLGLRQDDIINAVNGKPVRNGEEALSAYQSLTSATQFRIGVLRGGSNINLNFSVQ